MGEKIDPNAFMSPLWTVGHQDNPTMITLPAAQPSEMATEQLLIINRLQGKSPHQVKDKINNSDN